MNAPIVPPNDLDAESAVLGAVIIFPEELARTREILRAEDFFATANQTIWTALCALADTGKLIDVTALLGWLRDHDKLEAIGGAKALPALAEDAASRALIAQHAARIKNLSTIRKTITLMQRRMVEGRGDVGDPGVWLSQIQSELAELQERQAPSRIQMVGPAELFAPLEAPDYLIDGLIRRGSLTQLVAYGSSGKSWIAADAALSVASGQPFLTRFPCKQGKALILDWENGLYEERRRLQAIARARGLDGVNGLGVAPMPAIYMTDAAFEATLLPLGSQYDLIVIDTLKAASPGVDENDSSIRCGLDALRRIAEKTNTAFLVLVHSKKTSGNANAIDPREAGRGSSAIFDAADAVLHATYVEGEPLLVQQTKARLGRPVAPFRVSIVDTANGGVSVLASDLPANDTGSNSAQFDAHCDAVLTVVRELPNVSARVVLERVGGRYKSVGAALEYLERNGAVRNVGTPKAGKWVATD